jgi:hypothetical protein
MGTPLRPLREPCAFALKINAKISMLKVKYCFQKCSACAQQLLY